MHNFFSLQRHRLVNDTLKEELSSGVHALSIQVCKFSFNSEKLYTYYATLYNNINPVTFYIFLFRPKHLNNGKQTQV